METQERDFRDQIPGLAEFHFREALRELFEAYGRPQAKEIAKDILEEETK